MLFVRCLNQGVGDGQIGQGMEGREGGKLVLIGRGMDEAAFGGSLRAFLEGA